MMKKKLFSIFICVVILFSMKISTFAKVDSFVVDFDIQSTSSVVKGEEFFVSVGVDSMKNHILSGTIQVAFDVSKLEYVSASIIGDGSFDEPGRYFGILNDTQSGNIIVSFFSFNDCPDDYVKIVEIKFRAKSTENTDIVVYTDDWADEFNGIEYWDSRNDGAPALKNNKHTVSVTEKTEPDIPVCEHKTTEVAATGKAATCTETGLTDSTKCSVCDTVITVQEEIPATGHSFGEWAIAKAPTITDEGSEERVCSVCNEKETRAIDKLKFIVGDVDGDNIITAADARLALRISAGLESLENLNTILEVVDYDSDKQITAADARLILRKSAGLEI